MASLNSYITWLRSDKFCTCSVKLKLFPQIFSKNCWLNPKIRIDDYRGLTVLNCLTVSRNKSLLMDAFFSGLFALCTMCGGFCPPLPWWISLPFCPCTNPSLTCVYQFTLVREIISGFAKPPHPHTHTHPSGTSRPQRRPLCSHVFIHLK